MSEDRFGPKLNMFVCYCSSEDAAFPVAELARHSRRTNGWQSAKMCEYPQELGFRFEGEVELQNLRILVHESKIPSRIEIFVAEATEEERVQGAALATYDKAVFRRLGHVNFCTNEENGFEARELKTVSIRRSCTYLKLIIRKPHTNSINLFGQVGIVAISPHGHVVRILRSAPTGYGELVVGEQEDVPLDEMTPDARDAAIQEDEAAAHQLPEGFEGLDSQTARKVRELLVHKNRAVQEEDYDLAKALKQQIEALKNAGSQIAELEAQKKKAVAEEDYDTAKAIKLHIDELRAQAQGRPTASFPQGAYSAPPMGGAYATAPAAPFAPVASVPPPPWQATATLPPPPAQATARTSAPDVPFDERPVGGGGGGNAVAAAPLPPHHRPGKLHVPPPAAATSFDDKPAVAAGSKNIDDLIREGDTGGIVAKKSTPTASSGPAGEQPSSGNGLAEWEEHLNRIILRHADDQPKAEVLAGTKAQDAKFAIQAFGSYAAACLFSKRWQLREAAVKALVSSEGFSLLPNPSSAADAILQYAGAKSFGVNDALAAVFFVLCEGLSKLLKGELHGAPSAASLANGFSNIMADLLLKAGDNNARVREEAATLLTSIASSEVGPERVAHAALSEPENPSKKPLNHRITIARIHVVSLLLNEVGLNRKDVRTGLSPEGIMTRLILPSLQHSHQDVREGALNLLVDLYRLAPSVKKYVEELKPAQRQLVEERIGESPQPQVSGSSGGGGGQSPQPKGRAQVTRHDEPEMVSSSFTVEKGKDHAVLSAARQAREPPEAPKKGGAAAPPPAKQAAAKQGASSSAPTAAAAAVADDKQAKTCQFCDRFDKRFDEQTFHVHYLRTCPMLCPCPLCGQVTEISNLQNHIVTECEHKTLVRQCPLCKEAVRAEDLDEHVAARQCIPASSHYNVCPLCHAKLTPAGLTGWKTHLLKSPGCLNNPRRFDGGNGEEFE